MTAAPRALRVFAAAWAVAGWAGTLAVVIVRLGAIAAEAIASDLTLPQWFALVLNAILLGWAEGYRGFQRRFSPRTAARVLHLRDHATVLDAVLAPLFCVGFVGATPRLRRLTWIGTGLIVLAVIVVQRLPQPWRGIVDVGVVIGLSWGLLSFLVISWRALASGRYPATPEVARAGGGL